MSDPEYNEGDLVEAVYGDEAVRGRVWMQNGIPRFKAGREQHYPRDMVRRGYTITIKEKAKPPVVLPTEPGSVIRISNEGDQRHWLAWRARDSTWDVIDFRGEFCRGVADPLAWVAEQDEPVVEFTLFAPVAEVLKRARDDRSCDAFATVAAEFGVTL